VRKKLRVRDGQRTRFEGTFVRYGTKPGYTGYPQPTILLKNIVELESGQAVADHLWFNKTKGFTDIGELAEGDAVEFDARVKEYAKGYRGRDILKEIENPPRLDYKLSHPTKITRRGAADD